MDAYINQGASASGWSWTGAQRIATGVPGANASTVLFVDINGDGRADYLVKNANGGLDLWLNIGDYGSANITWVPYSGIATGVGNPNVSLADINGDGKLQTPRDITLSSADRRNRARGLSSLRPRRRFEWLPERQR